MNPKQLRYHPVRYAHQMREVFGRIETRWEELQGELDGKSPRLRALTFGAVIEGVYQKMIAAGAGRAPQTVAGNPGWWAMEWEAATTAYAQFRAAGENIFHFGPGLVEMLSHTDVDDVPSSSLRFPFRDFYIHLEAPVPIAEGVLVDGVYVSPTTEGGAGPDNAAADGGRPKPSSLHLVFTTVRPGADYLAHRDPLEFLLEGPARFFVLPFEESEEIGPSLREALAWSEDRDADEGSVAMWAKATPALVQLTVNCLLYLSYERREVEHGYPPHAPENLVRGAKDANSRAHRERSQGKLAALGFRKVYFCGRSIGPRSEAAAGAEMAPHWRRGHWRDQAHGPRHTLRKLLWIMPTEVRPDKGPPQGKHIYRMPGEEFPDSRAGAGDGAPRPEGDGPERTPLP